VTSWNPNASGTVNALAVNNDIIYTGGYFSLVGNQTRNRLAAIDVGGSLTSWDPNANGRVDTLAISDDIVYVGGSFTTMGGQTRNHLAAINVGGDTDVVESGC